MTQLILSCFEDYQTRPKASNFVFPSVSLSKIWGYQQFKHLKKD